MMLKSAQLRGAMISLNKSLQDFCFIATALFRMGKELIKIIGQFQENVLFSKMLLVIVIF